MGELHHLHAFPRGLLKVRSYPRAYLLDLSTMLNQVALYQNSDWISLMKRGLRGGWFPSNIFGNLKRAIELSIFVPMSPLQSAGTIGLKIGTIVSTKHNDDTTQSLQIPQLINIFVNQKKCI